MSHQGKKSKRLSNTVQFKHKYITKPTVTHTDKVRKALSECVATIQGLGGSGGSHQMRDLKSVFIEAKDAIQRDLDFLQDVAPVSPPQSSPQSTLVFCVAQSSSVAQSIER